MRRGRTCSGGLGTDAIAAVQPAGQRGWAGIARLADFLIGKDVRSGALVPVLEEVTLAWSEPVWAGYYKQGALAPRVGALVEFLAQRLGDVLDPVQSLRK